MVRWLSVAVAVGLAACAAAQGAGRAVVYPLFELRVASGDVFTETAFAPLFGGLFDAAAEALGVPEDGRRARLRDLGGRLRWPLRLDVGIERVDRRGAFAPVVRVTMPQAPSSWLEAAIQLGEGKPGAVDEVEVDGRSWRRQTVEVRQPAGPITVLETTRDGTTEWLLAPQPRLVEPAPLVRGFARAWQRESPADRALRAEAEGDVGFVLRARGFEGFGRSFSMLVLWRLIVGPRFSGMAGSLSARGDGVRLALFADVRPGQGWAGACVEREPRSLDLTGWIPDSATDYTAFDASVSGFVRMLNTVAMVESVSLGDLHSDLRWLGDVDALEFVDTHLTGQAFVASELGVDDPLLTAGRPTGAVVGLGTFDGARVLEVMQAAVAENKNGTLRPAPELGPGVMTAHDLLGKPVLHVTALRDAVLLAAPDDAGAAMLRACLTAGGRGQLRAGDRTATVLGRGAVVRHVRRLLPDVAAGVAVGQLLDAVLEARDGVARWHLVVGADGARLRLDL